MIAALLWIALGVLGVLAVAGIAGFAVCLLALWLLPDTEAFEDD